MSPGGAASRMSKRSLRLLAASGVLVWLATSCSGMSGEDALSGSQGANSQAAPATANYETILTNRAFIERAEQELIRRCMVAAGFEYTPVQPLSVQLRQLTLPLSVQAASASGYSSVLLPVSGPDTEANAAYVASLSDADKKRYRDTLIGSLGPDQGVEATNALGSIRVSSGGCTR